MKKRIDKNSYFMAMAKLVSLRGTCSRRKVGCILVDENYHVLATGYNGTPKGMPHCIDSPCPGHREQTGVGLDLCEAVHAEQNALLQCGNVEKIFACYTTTFPCNHCLKLLMNTGCKKIYYEQVYDAEKMMERIRKWQDSGIVETAYNDGGGFRKIFTRNMEQITNLKVEVTW